MTQEFHLSVTPVGNNQYLVRTERVAPGVPLAEEQVTWTVENWLTQARQLMGDPLQGVLQGDLAGKTDLSFSRSSLNLVELGQQLYTALFQGTLRDSWVIAQGVAQNRREALRLRLGLKGADLPRLPWEVMYGTDVPVERLRQGTITAAPRPLATGTRLIFSRYQSGTRLVEEAFSVLPEPNQPLRILMVVSAPTDQEQLKLYREVKQMQQELQSRPSSWTESNSEIAPDIQLTILNHPGREQLTQALEQGRYQVLHYAGHSDLSAAGGSLYLVNNRTGLTEILTGDDLAGLLVNNGIRLAVFNSCRGAYTAAVDASGHDRNLAEALVSRGIPAVLAMAEQIPDNVALNLTGLFYRNLKLGFPIDLSLNRARQGLISAYGSHQFYWALPVLYLHPEFDGYLTAGDRSHDNPADRFSLMPSRYSPPILQRVEPAELAEPVEKPVEKQPVRSAEEAWTPVAHQNTPPEDLEPLEDETAEDGDRLVIAEMLQQLTPQAPHPYGNRSVPAPSESVPANQNAMQPSGSRPLPTGQAHSLLDREPVAATTAQTSVGDLDPSRPTPQPQGSPKPHRIPAHHHWMTRFLLLPCLGAMGLLLAYVGLHGLPQPVWQQWFGWSDPTPTPEASVEASPSIIIDPTQSVAELQAQAIDSFEQQQIDQGLAAVKALLDRNALPEASEAIAAVPEEINTDPSVDFLRGRLAWQGVKAKDGQHVLSQAREFWEKAAKADPKMLDYQEALGFAYYAEGNLDKAFQTWWSATSSLIDENEESLGCEAGIALVLQKAAANQPKPQQDKYLLNAVQTYQKVISREPDNYQSDALRKNWLWTEATIKDWEALKQLAAKQADQLRVPKP